MWEQKLKGMCRIFLYTHGGSKNLNMNSLMLFAGSPILNLLRGSEWVLY